MNLVLKKAILGQQKLTNKEKIILLLFSFVVLYFTFMPFKIFLNFMGYLPYGLGVIACLLASLRFVSTKMFVVAFIYTVVLLLNAHFKTFVNLGNVLSETSSILFTGFMVYYALKDDRTRKFKILIIILFSCIIVVYATQTFRFYLTTPGIMRWAAMERNYDDASVFFALGLAPYAFSHGLSCIIPAFVLGLKKQDNTRFIKFFSLTMLLCSFLLIYVTEATGALIVALFSMICALLSKIGSVKNSVQKLIIVSLLMVPIIVSETVQIGIIHSVRSVVSTESDYLTKLDDLEHNITSDTKVGEGDIQTRSELLDNTMESIFESPIIGVSDKTFGNHNALLDRWAQYGVIAFLPIVFYIIWMIKFTWRYIPDNCRIFYLIGVFANLLMMFSKSMFAWYQWFSFLVVLPIMIYFCGNIKNEYIIKRIEK